MPARLGAALPAAAAELAECGASLLREVAQLAVQQAVRERPLADARADNALAALVAHRFGETPERTAVGRLAEELDDEYWALEPATDAAAHQPIEDVRLDVFRRARAATALWAALDPDPLMAAQDALYEAWIALEHDADQAMEVLTTAKKRLAAG